ncbi:CDC42 binding protein kinase [Cichlidogyrus casuarinus]|uniref:CDC42 binding protein kinase n=1 Tax=Cichlidogyrus casuarinus TaxID=1844966 RepID=A0ABD2Q1X0_9PLAT
MRLYLNHLLFLAQARKQARMKDSLDAANGLIDRYKRESEASKRALSEERNKTRLQEEKVKKAEDVAYSASQRAHQATEESSKLRDQLHQKEDELSKANKAIAAEKAKCSAAVNKIKQILSGESAEALELMMLADTAGAGNGMSPPRGRVQPAQQMQRKNLTQQHLVRQLDRKNKKLANDLDQLQARHAIVVKELRNKIDQLCTKQARTEQELMRSRDELRQVKAKAADTSTVPNRTQSGTIMRLRPTVQPSKSGSNLAFPRTANFLKHDSSVKEKKHGLVRRSSFGDRRIHSTNMDVLSPLVTSIKPDPFARSEDVLLAGFMEMPAMSNTDSASNQSAPRVNVRRKKQLFWTPYYVQVRYLIQSIDFQPSKIK